MSGVNRFNSGSASARKHGNSASPAPATVASTSDALALLRDTMVALPACFASHLAAGAAVESVLSATTSWPDRSFGSTGLRQRARYDSAAYNDHPTGPKVR